MVTKSNKANSKVVELSVAMPMTRDLIGDIRSIVAEARRTVVRQVNTTMILAYWLIGRRLIVEEQKGKRAAYGEKTLETVSRELTAEFGHGFGESQLRYCRLFFQAYPGEKQICDTLCDKLSWSHYKLMLGVADPKARAWYLHEAESRELSVRQLEREIASMAYHRVMANQIDETDAKLEPLGEVTPRMLLKDPCVAEFLNLQENLRGKEKKVEQAILDKIEKFILELGKGFALVGRQVRVPNGDNNKYIDFVFYNYILRCFVLVDLKTKKLDARDIGQMDTYRRMYDGMRKGEDDNPTVGILLCTEINESDVRFSIMSECEQMFATKLMTYMPSKAELLFEIEQARARTRISRSNKLLKQTKKRQ